MPPTTSQARDHREQPTYWFAVMEIARERGDFARAAEAKDELRRLGVRVTYGQPTGREVAHATS